jgi:hypothetical protein
MDSDQSGWMNPDEEDAIWFVHSLENSSYLLRDAIFNETRFPVWEAAVECYDPGRHVKGLRSYVKMTSDQDKLLALAVKSPCIEVNVLAASKLDNRMRLEDEYAETDDAEERRRILRLIDFDDDFVNGELAKMSREELDTFSAELEDSDMARRIYDRIPEELTDARDSVARRFVQLSSESELLDLIRDEKQPHQIREAAIGQLYDICKEKYLESKRIAFKPGDSEIISSFAREEDEDNKAKALLSMHKLCWKCGHKMELNGTYWGQRDRFGVPEGVTQEMLDNKEAYLFFVDFYNTKRRMATYLCPNCGNRIELQVEPWR